MTRVCSKCKAFLGEKCPECGTSAIFHGVDANGRVEALCPNQRCVVSTYRIGEAGVTHGYCDACMERLRGEKKRVAGGAR